MNSRRWIIALAALSASVTCVAASPKQLQRSNSKPQCIVRLLMPSYPYIARTSNSSATLQVVVKIDAHGTGVLQDIGVMSGSNNLGFFKEAAEKSLKAATFSDTCAGDTVGLTFRFKMGDADAVWFEYPNIYEIVALPLPLNKSDRKRK